ncbi:hypothetical protein [Streptosporangium roseum]|uniref:hypothetical protein n=1 Tax=Streptosporangium roseum TaxID=2001 RepID=UPI0033317FF4
MNNHHSTPLIAASHIRCCSKLLMIAITALALTACSTPRDEEQFRIINGTKDTVSVKWKFNEGSFATLAPGESVGIGAPDSTCQQPTPGDDFIAVGTTTRKTYTYGQSICYGQIWKIVD